MTNISKICVMNVAPSNILKIMKKGGLMKTALKAWLNIIVKLSFQSADLY